MPMVALRCPGFHRGVVQINGYTGIQLSGLVIQASYLYSHLAVLFLQGMCGACVYFPCVKEIALLDIFDCYLHFWDDLLTHK